jgi:hypothetical protein
MLKCHLQIDYILDYVLYLGSIQRRVLNYSINKLSYYFFQTSTYSTNVMSTTFIDEIWDYRILTPDYVEYGSTLFVERAKWRFYQ